MRNAALGLTALLLSAFTGCQSAYYATMEKFGLEKRDLLVDRVEDARDAQAETKETFADALEEFSALIDFKGGNLEKLYDRLRTRLTASEASAARVTGRIDAIESVADALFSEWESELDAYTSESLRRQSQNQLERTRTRYTALLRSMRRAEARMPPVLAAFRDQVLYLKHNLNAQTIASLESSSLQIQSDVSALIAEMEAAIAEADAFINSMQ